MAGSGLTGNANCWFALNCMALIGCASHLDREVLHMPECLPGDLDLPVESSLRPPPCTFDQVIDSSLAAGNLNSTAN